MYVLVRKDLSETYRCVQGAHALAQFALEHPNSFKTWNNRTIVFLSVRNLNELRVILQRLRTNWLKNQCPFSLFTEPDLDNQFTSLAYFGTGDILKDLKTA
jgi:hypothetical protein